MLAVRDIMNTNPKSVVPGMSLPDREVADNRRPARLPAPPERFEVREPDRAPAGVPARFRGCALFRPLLCQ